MLVEWLYAWDFMRQVLTLTEYCLPSQPNEQAVINVFLHLRYNLVEYAHYKLRLE